MKKLFLALLCTAGLLQTTTSMFAVCGDCDYGTGYGTKKNLCTHDNINYCCSEINACQGQNKDNLCIEKCAGIQHWNPIKNKCVECPTSLYVPTGT